MNLGEKLRAIRKAEHLTQPEMATAVAISLDTYKNYELARRPVGAPTLLAVSQHPQFSKYTLWMMANQTAPASGQISPL